jgi:RNA polymerase sigma factor FliA
MELAKQQTKDNGVLARNQLIHEYLPYVKRIVQRISSRLPSHVEVADLLNAGTIGLIEAVDGYDPTRDTKFMTYAIHRIKGAVLSELRAQDIHSRSDRKKIREVENAYLRLEQKLGREATDDELADEVGIGITELHQIREVSSISLVSLEELGINSQDERDKLTGFLINNVGPDALTLTRLKEIERAVARAIEQLTEKERIVISLYYWDELTMEEIGNVLDISESRVSQIHSQAILRLRVKLKKEGLLEW